MANRHTGHGRNWKMWLAICAAVGVVVLIVFFAVFYSSGGGAGTGGGGLY